jgi:hypothetical protein
VDETTVSLIGIVLQGFAIVVAVWVFSHETRQSRSLLSIDLLFKMEDKFGSDEMRKARADAATAALAHLNEQDPDQQKRQQLDEILNFFEMLAMLVKQKKLDAQYAHFQFGYWFKHYYSFAYPIIQDIQRDSPHQWSHLAWMHKTFLDIEQQVEQQAGVAKEAGAAPQALLRRKDVLTFFEQENRLTSEENA